MTRPDIAAATLLLLRTAVTRHEHSRDIQRCAVFTSEFNCFSTCSKATRSDDDSGDNINSNNGIHHKSICEMATEQTNGFQFRAERNRMHIRRETTEMST
jgi:hypothetical protein